MTKLKSVFKLFVNIWVRPRKTMREIIDTKPGYLSLILSVFGGIIISLYWSMTGSEGDRLQLLPLLVKRVVIGPFIGLALLYIAAPFITWSGKWIGGKASHKKVRAAVAWSLVPQIWTYILWIPMIILFGGYLFMSAFASSDITNTVLIAIIIGFGIIEIIISVWNIVILVKCVAEVQEFSSWKGILNVLIAGIILTAIGIVFLFVVLLLHTIITGV